MSRSKLAYDGEVLVQASEPLFGPVARIVSSADHKTISAFGMSISAPSGLTSIATYRQMFSANDGMHRTHALRMVGVRRCVGYTGRGELPYVEPDSELTS